MIPKARGNELTGILGREMFEQPPGDVTDAADLKRWYRFRQAYGAASKLIAPEAFPLQLDFELNSTCNLRCAFCVHGQERVPSRFLAPLAFESAVLEGEEYGLVSVKLNYINEPLLYPDWWRFVRYAKEHGVLNVYFATNGVLLNERNRERAIDERVSKVMISLDATTPETFANIRRSTQFELITRNIEELIVLRERRGVSWPMVRVNFLKTELNSHEAEAFVARWNGVADAIGFQDQVGVPGVDEDAYAGQRAFQSEFRCAFPSKMLVVDSRGEILPCCTFSGRLLSLGNLSRMTLGEAWTSDKMKALRREHLEKRWRSNPICRHCVLGGR